MEDEIVVAVDHIAEEDLEKAVDADIDAFEKFFVSLGNDPLARPERAAIKTYLYYKTHGAEDAEEAGGSF